jgi:hypothetical protein
LLDGVDEVDVLRVDFLFVIVDALVADGGCRIPLSSRDFLLDRGQILNIELAGEFRRAFGDGNPLVWQEIARDLDGDH